MTYVPNLMRCSLLPDTIYQLHPNKCMHTPGLWLTNERLCKQFGRLQKDRLKSQFFQFNMIGQNTLSCKFRTK